MRITRGMIELEAPLPFDIYKEDGSLLMRKGVVIYNQSRIDQFCEWRTYTTPEGEAHQAVEVEVKRDVGITEYIEELMFRLDIAYSNFLTNGYNVVNDVTRIATELIHKLESDPDTMIGMVHLRMDFKHSIIRTLQNAVFSILIAKNMGWRKQQVVKVACAALTENLGMFAAQDDFYLQCGALEEWQKEMIRKHPAQSVQMLITMGVKDRDWLRAVGYHHERMDGSGYPNRQKGVEIAEEARILAIADRYGATISPRQGREPGSPQDVMRYLLSEEKSEYDQAIVHHFIAEIGVYPPGITVQLVNGEVALVTHRRSKRTQPLVSSIWDRDMVPYPRPVERDTLFKEFMIMGHFHHKDGPLLNAELFWGDDQVRLAKDVEMFREKPEESSVSAEGEGDVTLF